MKHSLIDHVEFTVRAGDGGDGIVSFRREKFVQKGGPDGGDGGNGGSIYLVANPHVTTLLDFAGTDHYDAPAGERGKHRRQHGKDADDINLQVPVGTVVYAIDHTNKQSNKLQFIHRPKYQTNEFVTESDDSELSDQSPNLPADEAGRPVVQSPDFILLADLSHPGDKVLVARGGAGGRGNDAFKSSTNTTPMEREKGELGEKKYLKLEMKILADIGLVGLPNAGKSTLLSVLTAAKPEIANYPFTTISPNLGVMETTRRLGDSAIGRLDKAEIQNIDDDQTTTRLPPTAYRLVLADIPGLIEDAHLGKGLGIDFLKHIERCRALVYVIAPTENDLENFTAENLWQQYQTVLHEVAAYGHDADKKSHLIILNKIDLLQPEDVKSIQTFFETQGETILPVSAAATTGIDELKETIGKIDVFC